MSKAIVVISDLQAPFHDVDAVNAVKKFIYAYQPDSVVSVGDEIDFQSISRWAKGTELEWERSIGKDRDTTVKILEQLTVDTIVRSNHSDRLFNKLRSSAPGFLGLPELEIEKFLKLDELGINYYHGPVEIAPNWLLMHGDEGNVQPTAGATALGLAKRSGMSVVCGHTHRMGLTHYTQAWSNGSRTVWGMEVGHLMDTKHAKYIKAGLFTWQKGFGILHVDGKNVTPQIVPIIKNTFTVEGKTWRW
jgi:predicted phosphodiesterase